MSILFSRQCEYAIRGVLYLALKKPGEWTSIKDLSERLDVPYYFLGKILQSLVAKGMLESQRGPKGGFTLALSADKITLYKIIEAIDGPDFAEKCVLGFPECSGKNPCAVHDRWGKIREDIVHMTTQKNVAQMARDMKKPEYRLP